MLQIAAALLAPIVFLGASEGVLALCGVRVPRYVAFTAEPDYWIPCAAPGKPPGFQRSIARPWKKHQEEPPLFVRDKPADGYRVFTLGESSVQGSPYEVGSFTDWLRLRLGAMLPNRTVEVVNAGNAGWYSAEIRRLALESLEYRPDLLVWMVGHNEMAPQNLLDVARRAAHPWLATLGDGVKSLRTTHLLARWMPSLEQGTRVTTIDRKVSDEKPGCTDAEFAVLQARYRAAVESVVRASQSAGVPILLCTMPRNVRACPPSSSYFSDDVRGDTAKKMQWEQTYKSGVDALARKDARAALEALQRAEAIDASPARLHYALGQVFERLGEADAARKEYMQSLELDAYPMRSRPWVETVIRETAEKMHVPVVDLERTFDAAGKLGLAGDELICDNVHPNLLGHEVIATEILSVMERELHIPLDRARDVSSERGRADMGVDRYNSESRARDECLINLKLVVASGVVNDLWEKTRTLVAGVLAQKPDDWEIVAADGLLDAVRGGRAIAKEKIERGMRADVYVRLQMIFFYKTEPPYQRLLDAAGVEVSKFERDLKPNEQTLLQNRMARRRQR